MFESFWAILNVHRAAHDHKLERLAQEMEMLRSEKRELDRALIKLREQHAEEKINVIPEAEEAPQEDEEETNKKIPGMLGPNDTTEEKEKDKINKMIEISKNDFSLVDFSILAREVRQLMMGDWSRFETSKHYEHLLGDLLQQTKISRILQKKLLAQHEIEDMLFRQRVHKKQKRIAQLTEVVDSKFINPTLLLKQLDNLRTDLNNLINNQTSFLNRFQLSRQYEKALKCDQEKQRLFFHLNKVTACYNKILPIFQQCYKDFKLPELKIQDDPLDRSVTQAELDGAGREGVPRKIETTEESLTEPGEPSRLGENSRFGEREISLVGDREGEPSPSPSPSPLSLTRNFDLSNHSPRDGGIDEPPVLLPQTSLPQSSSSNSILNNPSLEGVKEKKKKRKKNPMGPIRIVEHSDGSIKSNVKLGTLLASDKGVEYFRRFAVESLNVENLQFYLRYNAFQELQDPDVKRKEAVNIYNTFIRTGSEMEINVSHEMRSIFQKIFGVSQSTHNPRSPTRLFD